MPRLEPRDHTISPQIAAEFTARHKKAVAGRVNQGDHGGAFHADQVMKLLQQPGCKALRIYHAQNQKGERAMILCGVDGEGRDMTKGIMMELCFPCPPWCDPDSSLK